MHFSVRPVGARPSSGRDEAFLVADNWDDWFQYSTMYELVIFDAAGTRHTVGEVKIGQFRMADGERRPDLPAAFESLDTRFFSLGQDVTYYARLNDLGSEVRDEILSSLRDIAADLHLFERAIREDVTRVSLLRDISPLTVRGQFHRCSQGGAMLTRYAFRYAAPRMPGKQSVPRLELEFHVKPESEPPTNIHVLIGRNGVGKTRTLRLMARALVGETPSARKSGVFSSEEDEGNRRIFANVVSVSFSAFDSFEPLPELKDETSRVSYAYIGLQRMPAAAKKNSLPKSPGMLKREFVNGANACHLSGKIDRWQAALHALETDPLFKEAGVTGLVDQEVSEEWQTEAASLFAKLSSGHKVVLLTITRLVETVDERTLVLIDEPEAHLHPPLLSAFVRALSNLLVERNGVAIIATHSPVVLQEVPRTCVWKLRRNGAHAIAERPDIETFGENVGILTSEVFGLEVTAAGFHQMIQGAVTQGNSYEQIGARFSEQLGAEARAIARSLVITRDATP